MEIASKIVWTTPKTTTAESRKPAITKETLITSMEIAPSTESSTTYWDLEIEYEDSHLNSTSHNEGKSMQFFYKKIALVKRDLILRKILEKIFTSNKI